jgi:hypothetical protein
MIYRILLALTFLIIGIILIVKINKQKNILQESGLLFGGYFKAIWKPLKSETSEDRLAIGKLKRALLGSTAWLFILMAFTGFIPVLFFGSPLTGLPLMIHVTLAPFFVLVLAFTALFYTKNKQFNKKDLALIRSYSKKAGIAERFNFLTKIIFWLLLVLSIPAILTIVLSMYPIFSVEQLGTMAHIHGYSVLCMFIITFTYFLIKIETQIEKKR